MVPRAFGAASAARFSTRELSGLKRPGLRAPKVSRPLPPAEMLKTLFLLQGMPPTHDRCVWPPGREAIDLAVQALDAAQPLVLAQKQAGAFVQQLGVGVPGQARRVGGVEGAAERHQTAERHEVTRLGSSLMWL